MQPKLLVLSCVWDKYGDIGFALQINEAFKDLKPEVIFYYAETKFESQTHKDFIEQNLPGRKLYLTPEELIANHKDSILSADVIINTTPKYSQMMPKVLATGYKGKYYRLFDYGLGLNVTYKNDENINQLCKQKCTYKLDNTNNIFTGFGPGSKGIFIKTSIPEKTLDIWDYDGNIFTCYVNNYDILQSYIEFINEKFASNNTKNLLVIQGKPVELNTTNTTEVFKHGNLDIINRMFTPAESDELFYHSNRITLATGNNSMSTCISYKKVLFLDWRPELTKTQCLFYDFINEKKYNELLPIFKYLINKVASKSSTNKTSQTDQADILKYIDDNIERLNEFYTLIISNYNLQNNLRSLIIPDNLSEKKIGGHLLSRSKLMLGFNPGFDLRLTSRLTLYLIAVIIILVIIINTSIIIIYKQYPPNISPDGIATSPMQSL